jgi:hypothetical protein
MKVLNQTSREQRASVVSQGLLLKPCCTVDVAAAAAAVVDVAEAVAEAVAVAVAVAVAAAVAPQPYGAVERIVHLVWR